ncbi:MAG: TIGR02206 family membrane protein [Spirochaetales bacterium]|nr:TIGR02206 family membrane protein [Spirochaetales bacterium]
MDAFWSYTPPIPPFVFFSPVHWTALGIVSLLSAVIIILLVNKKNRKWNRRFELIAGIILTVNELVYIVWIASFQDFDWAYHLPLHLCDTSLILLIIMLFLPQKNQVLYEILYFAGLGGALQALLTPIVGRFGFPHFVCFTHFNTHGFLVAIPLYFTFVRGMRISFKSLIRFVIIINGFLFFVMSINWLIQFIPPYYEKGNYLFLTYPPATGSIIDFLVNIFGPSPYYIIGLELLGLVICFLLYLPFLIQKKFYSKSAGFEKSSLIK